MTIQTFLKNLVISLQANTEKYRREQYKAKYRALRRRERTQIKRSKLVLGFKIALRFWWKVCFVVIFLIFADTKLTTYDYEFYPPNTKALELYSTNQQAFIHAKNLIEIIEYCRENDLLFSVSISHLILSEIIKKAK